MNELPKTTRFFNAAARLLRQHDGTLSRTLSRESGGFGLGQIPRRLAPDATTTLVCGYCSTGCGLDVHLKRGQAINLTPARDYSVNRGMACPKGWEALAPLAAHDRAQSPLVRNASGRFAATDWDAAMRLFSTRFKAIQAKHGKESVAFLGTGQIVTEELLLLGALAKFGMGMLHGDGNTRQCMATSAVAYKQAFGFDAPPYTYADLEESDVLVFVGSNLCIAHPIMWQRVCGNPHDPQVIVIDPRKTETAMAAGTHLALRPKSDLWLLYGLAQILVQENWLDHAFLARHTNGFDGFKRHIASFTAERVSEQTGISAETLQRVARVIHEGKRVSFWWTMGVNQSHEGVRVAQAIIALALMTGNIGRPGTGANSITGQCNAMGSRLFSNTASLVGGRDFTNAEHRREVASILEIPAESIPDRNSLAYDQIMEGVLAGKIRGLWIVATNTAHSWINQSDAHDILSRLEFLVVQDMYCTTETAAFAHLLLPAAGWGEKEGTFINSERRIGLVKQVSRAPGVSLADFYIFKLIAEAWGCGDMFRRWTSPEATFRIAQELTRGQPCDITGIDGYDMLERLRGVQWPLPEGANVEEQSERRLFENGCFFHPDQKARFLYEAPRALPEPTSADYPFTLLTGRGSSSQWHTQTRTQKSDVLRKLYPNQPYVELSPVDADRLRISPNDWVVVESRRGRMRARAFVTHVVQPLQVFVPMHYADANKLTFASFDPYSRQPSYKACAVTVRTVQPGDLA